MKLSKTIKSLSIEDSNIIKGIGILLIAFHNFFHWIAPYAKENEFSFSINSVQDLINGIYSSPLDSINLLFSFWGHYGVQLFIFISGYGLMKTYGNKNISWGRFVSKRINKLWPTFFFAIIVFYSLIRVFYFNLGIELPIIKAYLLKLTFLSNFFSNEVFSLNGPWWFYSMIVQLYLVFPILLKAKKKWGYIALIIISIAAYIIVYLYNPWFVYEDSSLYYFFIANLPVFCLGLILASKDKIKYHYIIGLIALVIFALGNFYEQIWYFSHLMFTIIGLGLIHFVFLNSRKKSYLYKVILFYGELSMYLFAIHGFLRTPFLNIAKKIDHPLSTIALSLFFVATSTLVALMLKYLVNNYTKLLKTVSNKVNSIQSKAVEFYLDSTKSMMQMGSIFLLILVLIRVYEYQLLQYHHDFIIVNINALLDAIFRDLLLGTGIIGFLLIPHYLLFKLNKALAKIFFALFASLAIIANIGLIQYYDLTLTPLDRVFLAYSWESIIDLSKTNEYSILNISPFIISIFLFNITLFYSKKIYFKNTFVLIFPIIAISLGLLHNNILPKEKYYKNEDEYYYTNNKLIYFVKDIIRYKPTENLDLQEISKSILVCRKVFSDRKYISLNEPFLRDADEGDPLGPFFYKTRNNQNPNVVLIIVESLCTPVSGPYTYKTSFTPFLDSLTKKSLYWRNNLATAERTFGVIPAIIGSLPYGERGFLDLGLDMPKHHSLINILARNNYDTRFFYGGWPHFNNMDDYMTINDLDTIISKFDPADSIPKNENGFSWGYSDRAIFNATFNSIPDSTKPYLSIYLTLSSHSPFMLKNQEYYMNRVVQRLDEVGIKKEARAGYIKNKKKLSTFVFFDDELRNFFKAYKQRDDYKNTIFIITGDHRGIIFPRSSQIDVYHTPLIIFSPLLKEAREFGGVSSHADIAPSLINFLKDQYHIETPTQVSWQGQLLDTSINFHSQQRMAFMRNNRDIRDYLHGEYYLATDNLYRLHDIMHLEKIDNEEIKSQLKKELRSYKNLSAFSFISANHEMFASVSDLVEYNLDFEQNIEPYYSGDIDSTIGYSGNHSLILRKDQEYGPLIPSIFLDTNITRVYIDISFMVLVSESGKQNPLLVASIQNKGKTQVWEGIGIMNNRFGTNYKWKKVRVSKALFLENKNSKGSELKIYLWNQHGTEMNYDNIQVKIRGKKK